VLAEAGAGFGLSKKVVIAGASQGGHAAFFTERFGAYYAPEYEVAGQAPLVPASSVVEGLVKATSGRLTRLLINAADRLRANVETSTGGSFAGTYREFARTRGPLRIDEKFEPVWEPRYLAAPGGFALPRVLRDVTLLISGGVSGLVAK
jgi:hypothetical protein